MSQRTDAPVPLRRRGPRPLLLRLTLAMLRSTVSRATSPSSNPASASSSTAFAEAATAIAAALPDPTHADSAAKAFPRAVLEETLRQDADLIAGIAAYRRHPYARTLPDPRAIWTEGDSRLLDYGSPDGAGPNPDSSGVPALFVPSLVNRAYVLD